MLFPKNSNYANKTINMHQFYVYFATALLCVAIIAILKYISLSKMRIDDRDRKKKPKLSTIEVLNLLRNLKSFPVSVHKGWKLHSFRHNCRVWCQEISVDCNSSAVNVYAAYMKTRVPPQLVLQILKDVSKTSSWKPGCLATSINSRPMKSETGIKTKGIMGNYPVQHDIVIEETSAETPQSRGIWSLMFSESRSLQTVQKEHRRYWHREDNGVCWHLQMCEFYQEWLFFLAQPVEEDIEHIVSANQAAAELLAVALQASNIDLSKSIQDQVINSGGWMFCGLDNDVVVLKKVSIKDDMHCYLGKGIIQANPKVVWNAVRNPRTKFTYDDSLKKVDVLEAVSDSIKIVYYYHEVLQLFKTECCDMIVAQSERVDRGDKYILAFQSTQRHGVTLPANTIRVNVLPSGWIIEPVTKEKKVFTMITYIMQIDFGDLPHGTDKSPFEDLVSKQPMSIAYLRQYLRGCTYHH